MCSSAINDEPKREETASPNDIREWVRLCETGELYPLLMEQSGIRNKDALKRRLYTQVLYGSMCAKGSIRDVAERLFPNVADFCRQVKAKTGNYRYCGRLMQHVESSLVIGTVCRRIMNERPEMFVATIHDSLFVHPEEVEYVRRVITEEFGRLGVGVRLHEEDYGQPYKPESPISVIRKKAEAHKALYAKFDFDAFMGWAEALPEDRQLWASAKKTNYLNRMRRTNAREEQEEEDLEEELAFGGDGLGDDGV